MEQQLKDQVVSILRVLVARYVTVDVAVCDEKGCEFKSQVILCRKSFERRS